MGVTNKRSVEKQDLRVLVAPIGALLFIFAVCYPITSYLEILPGNPLATIIPDAARWHFGLIPLWRYDDFPAVSWHPANIPVLLLLLGVWGWCIHKARTS